MTYMPRGGGLAPLRSHPSLTLKSGMFCCVLEWGVSHLLMFNRKGREKERRRKKKAGAKAEFSICFCFPWRSFQGLGSAKPPKTMASSVHFPLCNLPLCPLLTAINHSVMCWPQGSGDGIFKSNVAVNINKALPWISFFISFPLSLFLSFFYDSAAAAANSVGNKSEGRQAEWNGNSTFLSHNNYDVVIRNIFYEFLSTSHPVLLLSPGKGQQIQQDWRLQPNCPEQGRLGVLSTSHPLTLHLK